MKAAEELHLPKTLKPEYGGGLKEFVQSEHECFENTDEPDHFFTTQERQWLVLHLLQTLRATSGDTLPGLKLIEGQAIGMFLYSCLCMKYPLCMKFIPLCSTDCVL